MISAFKSSGIAAGCGTAAARKPADKLLDLLERTS
jgi:hypothetical protein